MQHPDFYAAIVTLTPVFLAAGLYALREDLRKPGDKLGRPATALLLLAILTFVGGLLVLGELTDFSDSAWLRWLFVSASVAQLAIAAIGFLMQATAGGEDVGRQTASEQRVEHSTGRRGKRAKSARRR
ncbi:hypothetical protein ACI78T_17145 [Blastococcus sp. SYSU D00922]